MLQNCSSGLQACPEVRCLSCTIYRCVRLSSLPSSSLSFHRLAPQPFPLAVGHRWSSHASTTPYLPMSARPSAERTFGLRPQGLIVLERRRTQGNGFSVSRVFPITASFPSNLSSSSPALQSRCLGRASKKNSLRFSFPRRRRPEQCEGQ